MEWALPLLWKEAQKWDEIRECFVGYNKADIISDFLDYLKEQVAGDSNVTHKKLEIIKKVKGGK